MQRTTFLAATSFWLASTSRTTVRAPAHTEFAKLKSTANRSASHEVPKEAEEGRECAKHAQTARDWLQRSTISIDIGAAALLFEDGHPAESAGRHSQLWIRVAEQEEEVAKKSIQAAKLESTTEKFMSRLETEQEDLFAKKDKLMKRVKSIKLRQAEQAQEMNELKKSESAMAGLKQWPGANELRIPFEQRRLEDLRANHAQTAAQLARNISDVQNGLKLTEEDVARWEGRKKVLQELGDKLESTSETLRERKRELYRQDRLLEGLEILLAQGRGDNLGKSKGPPTAEALARRDTIEQLLKKAHAKLGAANMAVYSLLQKLKLSNQAVGGSFTPSTIEAMRVLSDGNSQVDAGLKALGHVGGETEALSVAKVAILDVQTGFVTALKRLEKCMPENGHAIVTSKPTSKPSHPSPIDINKEAKQKHVMHKLLKGMKTLKSASRSETRASLGSDSSDPAEILRKRLHDFQEAAAAAQASAKGNEEQETQSANGEGQRSASRLSRASRVGTVPGDLQQKIKQLAKEVRAANSLISEKSEAE